MFKDKENGLVVDYTGIPDNLKKALNQYSPSDRYHRYRCGQRCIEDAGVL